ncbi:hypothetical protein DPX16_1895 [Anabarilius grahami]|uniref:Uncharacterized protein n=1 Tax=Anabarilius grahami TaxID=495550 RepID=A0A3N0YRY1_ANAGA|nr:hypothetical protein DPX16_1895 [Anabarilius grahami]
MIRWPDGPMSSDADSTFRIGRKKANEDQLQPTVRNTLRKLSRPTNKNCQTADRRLGQSVTLLVKRLRSTCTIIKMAFIKEESEDLRIEEVFSLKQEDTEEQTGGSHVRRCGSRPANFTVIDDDTIPCRAKLFLVLVLFKPTMENTLSASAFE